MPSIALQLQSECLDNNVAVSALLRKALVVSTKLKIVVINPSDLVRILDIVRNTILEWTLKLEQDEILGDGMTFTPQEQEKAMLNPNIRITNFQGILGNVNQSSVMQDLTVTVKADNLDSLCSFLTDQGVEKDDLNALRDALSADRRPTVPDTFGEKVSAWIARMVGKAASGAWK